ncbi:MAG: family 20 glycosylhydrolase [Planctomycetota bacterium]
MKINGFMIDCSRLLEPKDYYYRLLEFMARWKMNTLLLHFSDDEGLALKLKGFESMALPEALSESDIRKLVAFARARGIDVIPELESFGHAGYIISQKRYRHLDVSGNSVDPLHKDTLMLMRRLIQTVARVFPSRYIHLGCDEVDIGEYCRQRNLSVEKTWSDYVNQIIGIAHEAGKIPMIWTDTILKHEEIARQLRKDVVLVYWWYYEHRKDDARYYEHRKYNALPRLKARGFRDFIVAPSIAWNRGGLFLPTRLTLGNTDRMLVIGRKHKATGLINTAWSPYRYLQNALYYGIAYSAFAVRKGAPPDRRQFNATFARKTFGTALTPALETFLSAWPALAINGKTIAPRLTESPIAFSANELRHLRIVRRMGKRVLRAARDYTPRANREIWHGMVLAAQCAWLCAENLFLRLADNPSAERKAEYRRLLSDTLRAMNAEWDRTRYPDDPQKTKPFSQGDRSQYAMLLLHDLPRVT